MRIGKKPSRSRFWPKAGQRGKPKHISPEVVIGQLTPDLVSTIYGPKFKDLANTVLEQYADEILIYEEEVRELQKQASPSSEDDELDEAEVGADGSIEINNNSPGVDDLPPPPDAPFFHSQYIIDEMGEMMDETSKFFFSKEGAWKAQVNANKFERLMDEKYGIFRPFLKEHPQVEEVIRSLQRKYATGYFSPFRQTAAPIPKSTAVVILFMMQRGKMRWEIVVLSGVFLLIGLQPWALVLIIATVQALLGVRKNQAVGKMKKTIPAVESYYEDCNSKEEKFQKLQQPVGTPGDRVLPELIKGDVDSSTFDTIVLGSGPSALYTGALLSRAGRKVLLLCPHEDASGCMTLDPSKSKVGSKYKNIPFDVQSSNISKLSQQIKFLAPALSTQTDLQGGVRFAQVGTDADGHAFEIIEIPGMGHGGSSYMTCLSAGNTKAQLMEEAASFLGDGWPNADGTVGNSGVGAYLSACEQINATSNLFYASKIIPDTVNNARSQSSYGECATRYAAGLLNQSFPLNAHARSFIAAIGMRQENIRPNNTCLAAHVTHLTAAISGEGMYYPVGGPRALCHALANIIERNGGRVVTKAPVRELIFDKDSVPPPPPPSVTNDATTSTGKEDDAPCPRCVGVQLHDGRSIKFAKTDAGADDKNAPAVISTTGLVDTFIRMLPDDIRTQYKVPRGLPALSESRPLVKALFLLEGSATDLNLGGADYYRLPNAAKAIDEINQQTGEVKLGEIGWSNETTEAGESSSEENKEDNLVDSINKEEGAATESDVDKKRRRTRNVKFESGSSWVHIAFPSVKDPSFEEQHGNVSTCVVTFEADDDFVQCFESKPKLYVVKQSITDKSFTDRVLQRVKRDLFDLYPQLEDKVLHAEISPIISRSLMHNPERYAAKGVRADTPYPGLFVGGSDLTVSGSFSAGIVGGWLAANAVAGYNYIDLLFLQKTITSDIEQFLEVPVISAEDEEDLAVPFTQTHVAEDYAVEETEIATEE